MLDAMFVQGFAFLISVILPLHFVMACAAAYAPELKRAVIDVSYQPGEKCPHFKREIQDLKELPRGIINGGLPYRLCKALVVMCVLSISSSCKSSLDGNAWEQWYKRPWDRKLDGS